GPSSTVDDLEPCHGTGVMIRILYRRREGPVSKRTRDQLLDYAAVLLLRNVELEWRPFLRHQRGRLPRLFWSVGSGTRPFVEADHMAEPRAPYKIIFPVRDVPNRPAESALVGRAIRFCQHGLVGVAAFPERHRPSERQEIGNL